jgi:hypothetical protein
LTERTVKTNKVSVKITDKDGNIITGFVVKPEKDEPKKKEDKKDVYKSLDATSPIIGYLITRNGQMTYEPV